MSMIATDPNYRSHVGCNGMKVDLARIRGNVKARKAAKELIAIAQTLLDDEVTEDRMFEMLAEEGVD